MQFEFKGSENLAEGCSPNFPGLSTKALLPVFPWENNIFYKLSRSQQRRNKNQENVFHMIPVWTLCIRGCGRLCLLSSNSLAVSIYCILLEISKFGLLTFSVELRFWNICKVSFWLSFEQLSCCSLAFAISFSLEYVSTALVGLL